MLDIQLLVCQKFQSFICPYEHSFHPKLTQHSFRHQEEHMKGVDSIVNEASLFENPEEIKEQQHVRKEVEIEANRVLEHDM